MAPPDDYRMQASAAYYVGGPPSPAAKRVADAFLDLRPGALIVFESGAIGAERRD